MAEVVQIVASANPKSALDIGCGPGSFSIALAAAADGCAVTGIDINPAFLERARSSCAKASLKGTVELLHARPIDVESRRFDVVVCIGASQAIGEPDSAVEWALSRLNDGGLLVLGEGYWRASPSAEYLAGLGGSASDFRLLDEQRRFLEGRGLTLLHEAVASAEAWEAYERGVHQGRLQFAESLSGEEAVTVRQQADAWIRLYEEHGRHFLGFAVFVGQCRSSSAVVSGPRL